MDIVDRLKIFMSYLDVTNSQFADTANIARPTLSQIMSGRNKKISNEIFTKLHESFPELNMMWLMFGDGEMLNDGTPISSAANLFNITSSQHTASQANPSAQRVLRNTTVEVTKRAEVTHGVSQSAIPPLPQSQVNIATDTSFHTGSDNNPRMPINEESLREMTTKQNVTALNNEASPAAQTQRNIVSIMVFYDDNSFETFHPSSQS